MRVGPALSRAAYVLRLALAHGEGGRARRLLVGLGIAAGAAVLGASLAGSVVAADAKLDRALRELPAIDRSVHVAHFGIARDRSSYADLDAAVRRAVDPLRLGSPVRVLQFKEHELGRGPGILAALDDPARWVRLESGRLPRGCTPQRCEVLRLGGRGEVGEGRVPLVVVGRGTLTSALPFGRLLGVRGSRMSEVLGRRDSPPFLLARGIEATAALEQLRVVYRSYAWVFPLDEVHPWDADALRAGIDDAQATLQTRSFAFEVDAPTEAIATASAEAHVAGRRLLIVGGQAAALVLAFTILAAEALRREFAGTRRRLTWFGARRRQIAAVAALDLGLLALGSTVVGWILGAVASAGIAARAGAPAGEVLAESLGSGGGLVAALAVAAAAALALLGTVYAQPAASGRRLSALDLAAGGALAALLLALSRGAADPEELASERGSVALVLLLPALALFVAAVVFARVFVPALRALARPAARVPLRLRLPLLALARNPGRAAIAASFLVVSVGAALFALAYRATLERGVQERVDYSFPFELVVREDFTRLVHPLEAAPLSGYRRLGRDVQVVPAFRRDASVPRLGRVDSLTVLGLPAAELATLDGWRDDFSRHSRPELARRLAPAGDVELRGAPIPAAATALVLEASVLGDDVGLVANVRNARGDFTALALGATAGARPATLRAALPPEARGGRVVALTLTRSLEVEGHGQGNVPIVEGMLTLGPLAAVVDGAPRALADGYAGWRGDGGAAVVRREDDVRLRYAVTNDIRTRFRPRQPLDDRPVPVLASPSVAAAADPDGLLPLRLPGGEVTARVVATATSFPTLERDFLVADGATLATALDTSRPGAAIPTELWLAAPAQELPAVEAALRRPPFDALALETRSALERRLEDDPLARGTLFALMATALVALGLALLGLVLLVRGDLSDERGELFDLEAQGADPRLLEAHLRGRAAAVGVAGTAGGVAAGAALAGLVVSVVTVTAGGTTGLPPLRLVLDWPVLVLTVALFAAAGAILVALSTRRAFSAPVPRRSSG